MSIQEFTHYRVKCDECGDVASDARTESLAYENASLEGWECGARDLCHGCVADRSEE